MYLSTLFTLGLAALASARSVHGGRKATAMKEALHRARRSASQPSFSGFQQRASSETIIAQTNKTAKYKVDGTAIPDVHFDVGESYAGLMPISNATDASELFFWFFPSHNPLASNEILIWLNGGPGCSSLEGFLQENGPFLWQYGTFQPVQNPWTWVELTNVVWVEQPAGTGFSRQGGDKVAQNEFDVAEQFLGFFKNFVETFALQGRKVYITGESYAGYYVPYIADAMHNASDKVNYNIESIMIYDPSLTYDSVSNDIPTSAFMDYWAPLLALNKSFTDHIHRKSSQCGYDKFMQTALTFPPKGPLPTAPGTFNYLSGCDLWNQVNDAATLVNPCFDRYQVATTCPLLWDVLGFPGSFDYLPLGAEIYFSRPEVQTAINAPHIDWQECTNVLYNDDSPPSSLSVLPRVLEKNHRTIIAHGLLDYELLFNGTLMAVQNMTWNGKQGFSVAPAKWQKLFVPYHDEVSLSTLAGAGYMGAWYTERGLTVSTVDLSGHMVPQYAPSAAFRQLEFLLGRIRDLGDTAPFTT